MCFIEPIYLEGTLEVLFHGKTKKMVFGTKSQNSKRIQKGATISYLNNKYGISSCGTVSRWNREYDDGRLGVDNRGKENHNRK